MRKFYMSRINDQLLESVIYIYPSEESAKNGQAIGGTGFLVGVPSEKYKENIFIYAITNSHVIEKAAPTPVIRFNTQQGDTLIILSNLDDWSHHSSGDDLAIIPLRIDATKLKYRYISTNMFLTKQIIQKYDLGPGDDVFMIGRFIEVDGKQCNTPAARFGNISMMPSEKIKKENGYEQESFLIEMRSLSGFSGSPVFVHMSVHAQRPTDRGIVISRESGPWLLGVDWGHIPIYERVKPKDKSTKDLKEYLIRLNSGQTAVVPAWKLYELLHQEEHVIARQQFDNTDHAKKLIR
jgi:hypothetical protein